MLSRPLIDESDFQIDVVPSDNWEWRMAQDVWLASFAFLGTADLASVARTSRCWRFYAHDFSLWHNLDLSHVFYKVGDNLLKTLLREPRFQRLESLSLEGCSAITDASLHSIRDHCPKLRKLLLTGCDQITPQAIVEMTGQLDLEHIEFYRCTRDRRLVEELRASNPSLNLGFSWIEYCAAAGLNPDGSGPAASCHFEGRFNERGCWGRLRGRIIYENISYHRQGNYPGEIVFCCLNHFREPLDDVTVCEMCELRFRDSSMWPGSVVCKYCYDRSNIQDKKAWIPLRGKDIQKFGFSHIISHTLRVADRKNLPHSLRSYGSVPFQISYRLDSSVNQVSQDSVPVSTFILQNRPRLDEQLQALQKCLMDAKRAQNKRALLCFDSSGERIDVLADKRPIMQTRDGEQHLDMTVQLWRYALTFIYSIVGLLLLVVYLASSFTDPETPLGQQFGEIMLAGSEDSASPQFLFVLGGVLLAFFVIIVFLAYRYREQCEHLFRRFLLLDIFFIFISGGAVCLYSLATDLSLALEAPTAILIAWNFGFVGVFSLYQPVPPNLHRFYLVALNAVMAVLILVTLGTGFVVGFLALAAFADFMSDLRPNVRLIAPFIFPVGIDDLDEAPRILFHLGQLRIRSADLLWYALLIGIPLTHLHLMEIMLGMIAILSSIILPVFVVPFLGKSIRPLPYAFGLVVFITVAQPALISYISSQNMLTTAAVSFEPDISVGMGLSVSKLSPTRTR